ncbi:hypothetical protein BC830DRAFT_1138777 [Chytriomyces sp. MP71]|nr:hypothetical protein BC830DRAFT_1138777 [Chytriomyces sp. MP71]
MAPRISQPFTLLQLPPEVLFSIAQEYLQADEVLALCATSTSLRSLLNGSESLWKTLTVRRTGIAYLSRSLSWRQACFDASFTRQCPHVSILASEEATRDAVERFQTLLTSRPFFDIACASCPIKTPDLWLCAVPRCPYVGCGIRRNAHAVHHGTAAAHPVSIKLNTLEFWCGPCVRWIGRDLPGEARLVESLTARLLARDGEPFESIRCNKDLWGERRFRERAMYAIREDESVFLVAREFLVAWRGFLLGNRGPPGKVDNSALVAVDDGTVKGDLVVLRDFGVVSETTWTYLRDTYGGTYPISFDDIPLHHTKLRASIAMAVRAIVEQCKLEENEKSIPTPPSSDSADSHCVSRDSAVLVRLVTSSADTHLNAIWRKGVGTGFHPAAVDK